MSLTGAYNLNEGSYLVSLESVIKRKFDINPGSTIIWNGDPLDAEISINAIYSVRASPIDLVADQMSGLSETDKNTYKQRYPFLVLLKLRGEILHPEISFEIQLPPEDKGILGGAVNAKLNMLNEDPSALNKQVFALLVLGRFVQENPLQTESGGTSTLVRSTVGKFLSAQLNKLSSKVVPGVELNFDIQSYDDYQTGQAKGRTQVEIGVKKQLFNERLSVQVGGTIDVEGEKAKQNSASDITSDVTVEYKLTKDGRYRLKGFRHNQYEGAIEGQLVETGAGFLYVRDFNKWKEFFKAPKNKSDSSKKKIAMTRSIINKYFLIIICLLLAACSGTKHLPKGEKLYTGAEIKLESTDKINKRFIKTIAESAVRPAPNKSFLGMRPKLWMYMAAGENPKTKFKKWLKKTGEAPVLISSVKPGVTTAIIDAKLFNIGIFKSYTESKIVEKKHTAKVIYTSHIHKPYTVKELIYSISDDSLSQIILTEKKKSFIKPGEDYNLDKLKNERIRIDALLKNNGYFYFNPDYLLFKADTSEVNHNVTFKLSLKDSIPKNALTVYRINNVFIDQDYSLNEEVPDRTKDTIRYHNNVFIGKESEMNIRPRVILRSVYLKKNEIYSRQNHNITLNRLMSMGNFKFVQCEIF